MKRLLALIALLVSTAISAGCGALPPAQEQSTAPAEKPAQTESAETEETNVEKTLHLFINDTEVSVDWEENESVDALRALVADEPLTVQMSMYGGFEQVGSLGTSLPRNDAQTTTRAGDIVLYSGNQIVVFYGSNSWAYTRLGHITDQDEAGMTALLGSGDVTITLTME
ncbi:MAG: hypothetical protein II010_06320 [Oscillospiraceae bacterium]|nr:hypothetical protein [Oscillospiraceae bacterium]MBQ5442681.1 hypothetical protein [Oscillospiraceae bacterium]